MGRGRRGERERRGTQGEQRNTGRARERYVGISSLQLCSGCAM